MQKLTTQQLDLQTKIVNQIIKNLVLQTTNQVSFFKTDEGFLYVEFTFNSAEDLEAINALRDDLFFKQDLYFDSGFNIQNSIIDWELSCSIYYDPEVSI